MNFLSSVLPLDRTTPAILFGVSIVFCLKIGCLTVHYLQDAMYSRALGYSCTITCGSQTFG